MSPSFVCMHCGSRPSRILVSEEARMGLAVRTIVLAGSVSRDEAETLVLSGRTHAVAVATGTLQA